MTLDRITFTGVDDETDLGALAHFAASYQKFIGEFGVLVGSEEGGIFPSRQRVEDLRDLGQAVGFRTALHLCGAPARNLMLYPLRDQVGRLNNESYGLSEGFTRVQLNLHGDSWDHDRISVSANRVDEVARWLSGESLIIQHRGPWETVPPVESVGVEFLYDTSEGRGEADFNSWPRPPEPGRRLARVGYAGGIGSDNIVFAASFAEEAEIPVWLDMEARIRRKGVFDLEIVEGIYQDAIWSRNQIREHRQ